MPARGIQQRIWRAYDQKRFAIAAADAERADRPPVYAFQHRKRVCPRGNEKQLFRYVPPAGKAETSLYAAHPPALRAFSQRISLRFPRQYTLTERRVTFANPQHRAAIRKDANINKPWKATANGEKAFFGEALPRHCAKPMASTIPTPIQSRETKGAPIQNQRRLLRFTPYASR